MEEKKYATTLSFMKKKDFANGGYVIQGSCSVDDLKKLVVRDGKVYFKLTELKEETKFGAKYVLTEDDYMAQYGDSPKHILGEEFGKQPSIEDLEEEKPYKQGEITSNTKVAQPSEDEDLFA